MGDWGDAEVDIATVVESDENENAWISRQANLWQELENYQRQPPAIVLLYVFSCFDQHNLTPGKQIRQLPRGKHRRLACSKTEKSKCLFPSRILPRHQGRPERDFFLRL